MRNGFKGIGFTILLAISIHSCAPSNELELKQQQLKSLPPVEVPSLNGLEKAYFASGCFWCVEAIYDSVSGVTNVVSGYSGGHTDSPTYESTNTGTTGHAEAVEVTYDPAKVSFAQLVDVYFNSQNITQMNGQGPDRGLQYRSIIFYQNSEQKQVIDRKIEQLNNDLKKDSVAAEVMPFQKFWIAEGYHQDFKKNNPDNLYIQNVSNPRLDRFKRKMPELVK